MQQHKRIQTNMHRHSNNKMHAHAHTHNAKTCTRVNPTMHSKRICANRFLNFEFICNYAKSRFCIDILKIHKYETDFACHRACYEKWALCAEVTLYSTWAPRASIAEIIKRDFMQLRICFASPTRQRFASFRKFRALDAVSLRNIRVGIVYCHYL